MEIVPQLNAYENDLKDMKQKNKVLEEMVGVLKIRTLVLDEVEKKNKDLEKEVILLKEKLQNYDNNRLRFPSCT